MKPQPQYAGVTFLDNLVDYYLRFGSSGLNLSYEGLLLGSESTVS
jgi:hypothetical protein